MKKLFRRGTALLLSLAMALSLLCVSSFAAELEYAHLEIGAVTVTKLEAGDTVEIPVSVVGMKTGQTCFTVSATITLGVGLAWDTTTATWTGGDWSNKSVASSNGNLYAVTQSTNSGLTANGELCKLRCVVTEDYDGTNATVKLTQVKLCGSRDSTLILNRESKDNPTDKAAVLFNGTWVGNTAISPITVSGSSGGSGGGTDPVDPPVDPTPATYSIVASATPASVVAGQDVTVTVTVKGGEYVAAAVQLTWDTDKLTLKTAPTSGWDMNTEGTKYSYYNVEQYGNTFDEDTVIGTFVFTAKTLTAAATANINLDKSFVEGSFNDDGTSTVPSTPVSNTDASVSITMGELSVTVPDMDAITYDGENHAFDPVTCTTAGASITYSEDEDGTYSTTIPTKKDVGDYTLFYKVTKDGYTPASGRYTMNIEQRQVTVRANDAEKTYGEGDPELTFTVDNLVSGEAFNATIDRRSGEDVGTYDIFVEPGSNPNYHVTNSYDGTLTIKPATMTGWSITSKGTVQYTGSPRVSATVTRGTPADATVTYSWNGGANTSTNVVPSFTAAGTYTVNYKISCANYSDVTGSYTFTIQNGTITASGTDVNVTYDGNPHSIAVTVTQPEGTTISYRTSEEDEWDDQNPSFTNVTGGAKTVYWKVSKAGYNDLTGSNTVTINKAEMTGWSITTNGPKQYTGSDQVSATVTEGTPADATVVYFVGEDGTRYDTVPSFKDVGTYEVRYEINHQNYKTVEGSYSFTITEGAITASGTNVNVPYDGNPHSITVTVTQPEGTTISYRTSESEVWSTTNPTFTDVTDGAQTVYWKVSKTGYADKMGSNTVTITEGSMAADITVTAADTVTYDGKAHAAVKTATIPTGASIRYSSDNGTTWVDTIPSFTNASTYTVKYKVTKANYADVTDSVSFTINKCAAAIEPYEYRVSLGADLPTLSGLVTGLVNDTDLGTITYSCPTFDNTKVGDYPITVSYTENDNYAVTVDSTKNVTVSTPTYYVEYVSEYVAGYHMILVYTDSKATFSFDNKAMYDVSGAGYKYGNTAYAHVYAIVVEGAEGDTEETVTAKVKADMTAVAATLDYTKPLDVNSSDSVDLRDAVAVVAVYNVNETYMTSHMQIVLKSDVDKSKDVDSSDFNLIKAEYLK